ncbi:TPA: relaxase/mobilization nuclease domain-containing protein [Campylobacter jejuni]|nr:relaxase/mobilization nuclease domain-containing protein [Campylobacter jejuni]EDP2739663.1 relaxase/mobilization nuclease domain-containing protein [Campylobacter jejuni]EJR5528520.1 relaxase/mobilization nuclease domain-containing protein [Campylobacter jejuni]EJR5529290.1 relaxase/mobilization nuclease domain-containing protein [Campylobacter jejuni]MCC3009496.1 relaxase/mobilization nuclease domain-containing protein [Campylobacter jejuni]
MKKIITLFFMFITLAFATPTGNLKDFTEMVSIRSLETGIFLSAFRDTSKDPIDQNWNIKEIVLSDELKQKDKLADELPFGYVQFTNPKESDLCLAILEDGTFGAKSCQDDLKDGKLETVFSIMPTTTSAVQIRSLVLESDECIVTFFNPNIPIQKRFGIAPCTPEQAHKNAVELAEHTKAWKGHEVLIATHIDKGHIHTHFIVNSVNYENGHKLQWM